MQAQGAHRNTFKATGSKEKLIGNFPSAAEAALAVALHLGPEASRAAAERVAKDIAAAAAAASRGEPMSEEEARRLATEEGLQLVPSYS